MSNTTTPVKTNKNATLRILLISIVIGLIAAFLVNTYINSRIQKVSGGKMETIVIAATDIHKGDTIKPKMLSTHSLPSFFLHYKAIKGESHKLIIGGTAAHNVPSGQPILYTDIESRNSLSLSQRLRSGDRAMSIKLDSSDAVGGFIQPGDRIDMLLSYNIKGGHASRLLLQNITVIAVDGKMTVAHLSGKKDDKSRKGSTDITLKLTAEEASVVSLAEASGTIRLLLRNVNDIIIKNQGETTSADLHKTHAEPSNPKSRKSAKVYKEGKAIQDAYIPKNIEKLKRLHENLKRR